MKKIKNISATVNATSSDIYSMTDLKSIKPYLSKIAYYKNSDMLNNDNIVVALSQFVKNGDEIKRNIILSKYAFVDSVFSNGIFADPVYLVEPETADKKLIPFLNNAVTSLRYHLFGYMYAPKKGDGETGKAYKRNASVICTDFHNTNDVTVIARQGSRHSNERNEKSLFYRESTNGVPCEWEGELMFDVDSLRYINLNEGDDMAINQKCLESEEFDKNLKRLCTFKDVSGGFKKTVVKKQGNDFISWNEDNKKVIMFNDDAISVIIAKLFTAIVNLRGVHNKAVLRTRTVTVNIEYDDNTTETIVLTKENNNILEKLMGNSYVTTYIEEN